MSLAIEEQLDETTAVAEPVRARWVPQQYFDPEFRAYLASELDRLRHLRAGWDGYRAATIDTAVLDAARALIFRLPVHFAPRPHVVPLSSGGLQLEWSSGQVALELEFESPAIIRYLKWNPEAGQPEENTVAVTDDDRIEDLIRWYARQHV